MKKTEVGLVNVSSFDVRDISEEYIQSLESKKELENEFLEYKRSLLEDNMDLAKVISAFANAKGGLIIFGMDDSVKIVGLTGVDFDKEIQKIDSISRTKVDPPINVTCNPLKVQGKQLLVVKVPMGIEKPYCTKKGENRKFYIRSNNQNTPMSMNEIRRLTVSGDNRSTTKSLLDSRINRIIQGETPAKLYEGPLFVLHMIPMPLYLEQSTLDVSKMRDCGHLFPITHDGYTPYVNSDGVYTCNREGGIYGGNNPSYSYAMFFKNGVIEAVDWTILNSNSALKENKFIPFEFGAVCIEAIDNYRQYLVEMNITNSLNIYITFLDCKGFRIHCTAPLYHALSVFSKTGLPTDRFTASVITETGLLWDTRKTMKPAFNEIWNASGFPNSGW